MSQGKGIGAGGMDGGSKRRRTTANRGNSLAAHSDKKRQKKKEDKNMMSRSNKIFQCEIFFVQTISCIALDCSGAGSGAMRNIPVRITACSKHSAEQTISKFAIPLNKGTTSKYAAAKNKLFFTAKRKFVLHMPKAPVIDIRRIYFSFPLKC